MHTPAATNRATEHFDSLTMELGEVKLLAGPVEAVSELPNGADVDLKQFMAGCGALSRVIAGKMRQVEQHANALVELAAER